MSTQEKHTPGPWSVFHGKNNRVFIYAGEHLESIHDGNTLAEMQEKPFGGIDEEGEANARLIAAAPELLEALEHLLEGESCQSKVNFDGTAKPSPQSDCECWTCEAVNNARAAIAKART